MQQNDADGLTWGHYAEMIIDAARSGNSDRIKAHEEAVRMMAAASEALRVIHPQLTEEQKELVRVIYDAEFRR